MIFFSTNDFSMDDEKQLKSFPEPKNSFTVKKTNMWSAASYLSYRQKMSLLYNRIPRYKVSLKKKKISFSLKFLPEFFVPLFMSQNYLIITILKRAKSTFESFLFLYGSSCWFSRFGFFNLFHLQNYKNTVLKE